MREMLPSAMAMVTAARILHRSCIVLIFIGFIGCGPEAGRRPAAVYQRAESLRRAGDMPKALAEAQRGFQVWRDRPNEAWHWKFRLLAAETLISQSKYQEALQL